MDKFMEILKRYREGTASEEERRIVEEEIEKNRAINDLIAEEFEYEFDLGLDRIKNEKLEGENNGLGDSIKKAVNKRFRKMMIMSAMTVLITFVVLRFIVSPIMDSMYYNPSAVTQGQYFNDITFDMFAFTELNVPGYRASTTMSIPKGFGRYDLIIRRRNLFDGDSERISFGQKGDRREGFFDYLYGNNDYWFLNLPGGDEEEYSSFDYKIPLKELKEMDKKNYVSIFLVFNNKKTLVEYWDFYEGYDLELKWLAVEIGLDSEGHNRGNIGFNPQLNDGLSTADRPDQEKYPFFQLHTMFDVKPDEIHGNSYPEKMAYYYEGHFKSLLKYMLDREDFVRMYDYNYNRHDFYKQAYEYVDENGVEIYGMLVFGEAGNVIELIENEDIYSIVINDVKVSKY